MKSGMGKTRIGLLIVVAVAVLSIACVLLISGCVPTEDGQNQTNQSSDQNQSEPAPPQNQSDGVPEQNDTEPEEPEPQEQWEDGQEFTWNNLSFVVEKKGDSTQFKTKIKIIERHGLASINTILTLKNSPTNLEKIPCSLTKMPGVKTYISYDNSVMKCKNTMLGGVELSFFLGLLGVSAKGAMTTAEGGTSPEKVKTCEDASETVTVAVLQSSKEKTQVKSEGDGYCVILEAGPSSKCQPIKVAERYILGIIELGISQGIIEAR